MSIHQSNGSGRGNTSAIQKIVIAGGGTAGWMVAAALSKVLQPLGISISLIESDEIGSIGVGEATIPAIHAFNSMLGLDQPEFMRFCKATFKLGIQFNDWGAMGDSYIHPFAAYGRDLHNINFHELWLKYAGLETPASSFDDYNLCAVAAKAGRFTHPVSGKATEAGMLGYAFHFDASLYAQYLRRYSVARGVARIEGKISEVLQDSLSGLITGLRLESATVVDGDLFIDCTGFRGLLIEQCLKSGYDDWNHWLPCDRAVAVQSESHEPPVPYTRSTADTAGWRWRIPLQHRVGHGYVYSSQHISDDEAQAQLLNTLDGRTLSTPRRIRFVTGRRRVFWNKNCVAIGLAAGFMEPLESTSIHLIHTSVLRLLAFFPDKRFDPAEVAAFNRATASEYEATRDFLILHYKATVRDDSPFWRQCLDMEIPDTLQTAIDLFRVKGRLLTSRDHLFSQHSWLSVMIGQGLDPAGYDPLVDGIPPDVLQNHMEQTRKAIGRVVAEMPIHETYIKHFCGLKG